MPESATAEDIRTRLSPICVKYDPKGHALMSEPDFIHGDYTIKWLEEWLAKRTG